MSVGILAAIGAAKRVKRALLRPGYWREQDRMARRLLTPDEAAAGDVMSPLAARFAMSGASELRDHQLADVLGDARLGEWTIDGSSLEYICRQARLRKPAAVLEFGSGVSTVCLASVLRGLHGGAGPWVFSVVAVAVQEKITERRLEKASRPAAARVVHVPLTQQTIEGREIVCYALTPAALAELLGNLRPDMVLIDGPDPRAGRFGTLPLVKDAVASRAAFFLHDGLRQNEIDIARGWQVLPYLQVDGIRPIGRGVVCGRFRAAEGNVDAQCVRVGLEVAA